MTASAHIAARHAAAIKELAEILERHDPELTERIRKINHGDVSIASPKKSPLETAALHAELMLCLGRALDEQLPKKRGRPRKAS
jgi:hypothetical protein